MKSSKQSSRSESKVLNLGQLGEAYAAAFIERHGYQIVGANFTFPVGRNLRDAIVTAEIDLVAYDGPTLCFIEVKTRASDWFASPEVNIVRRKQRQICRAARAYRNAFGLQGVPYRFDVVTVVLSDEPGSAPEIDLIRGFWTDAVLRKYRQPERYP